MSNAPSRGELLALIQAWRHERETHRRAATGTHARDAAETRMRDIQTRFERTLRQWGVDERLRQAWRNALHHNAPAPLRPSAVASVLFRGRAENGSICTVRRSADGLYEVDVDGSGSTNRLRGLDLQERDGRSFLPVGNLLYEEHSALPADAMGAFRRWVDDPRTEPPWTWAYALVEDGLVDGNFAVTPRGRRVARGRVPVTA